jgi:3-dehydroquinate synthase
MRGVPWYGVPTTVVAQVDSSIGGKTGIDLAAGKNLAGAFHHPAGVLVDPELLGTLPDREFRAGLAEVAKIGFATDAVLFRMLERAAAKIAAREPDATFHAVRAALAAKIRVVQADEREREGGPRTALNFGHTLGHALETAADYRGLRHGEAVAIGMRFVTAFSERFAGLDPDARARLEALLDRWRLPRCIPGLPVARIERAMRLDKKRSDSRVRWVLTPRLGHASVPRLISARVVRTALLEAGATA